MTTLIDPAAAEDAAVPSGGSAAPRPAILRLLEEERRLYARLLRVARAKRDALLAGDVETLSPLVREMDGITRAVEQLERERLVQVGQLTGGSADDRFGALAPYFTGADGGRLALLRDELRETVGELRAVNDLNAALVHQALSFTEQWTRLIRAALPATYTGSGAVIGPESGRRAWSA